MASFFAPRDAARVATCFEPIGSKQTQKPASPAPAPTARQRRREQLALRVATQPGWSLHETDHYFIVCSVKDPKFLAELERRCEAIHTVIRTDLPGAGAHPMSTDTAPSVIRMCRDVEQYHAYGGPVGLTGYWNYLDEEIVLYDEKLTEGRAGTWATLNTMVCLEYLFTGSGNNPAAAWFICGHSDYYGGFELAKSGPLVKPFAWRVERAKADVRAARTAPLQEFVRWTQAEYYGQNPRSIDAAACYAQGWSFIWFLRHGQKSKLWNPAWDKILDTCWVTWLDTNDWNAATERAFAGVDWKELQTAWEAFTREL